MKNKFSTEERMLIAELKKYRNRSRLHRKAPSLAKKLLSSFPEILEMSLPSMRPRRSLDDCICMAKRCKTRKEFETKFNKIYAYARNNGWLEQCCAHMEDSPAKKRDKGIKDLKARHDRQELPPTRTGPGGTLLSNIRREKWFIKKFPDWTNGRSYLIFIKHIKQMKGLVKMKPGQKWKGMNRRYLFVDKEYGDFMGLPTTMVRCSFPNGYSGHPRNRWEARKSSAKSRHKKVKRSDGKIFNSAPEASKELRLSRSSVSNAIRRNGKCSGYTFKYVED